MQPTRHDPSPTDLRAALSHPAPSTRLRAALAAGTRPDPVLLETLVDRCGTEPDFFVRDMLTWAVTRHPARTTVPRLLAELGADRTQARSQALHTLSKIGDRAAWPAVVALVHDTDDDVARTAWRAAVALVPSGEEATLAAQLAQELGRGDRETQLSLSRALVALGDVVLPLLEEAAAVPEPRVRAHARATERLRHDPESGFDLAREEATRIVLTNAAPAAADPPC